MKSSARLKINVAITPWLLLLPMVICLGCRSQWPCDISNPYGYSATDGAALDPYAQPDMQPNAQPYLPPPGPLGVPAASTQPALPPGNLPPQFAPATQQFQPPATQPLGDGSGIVNPFSQGPPPNPYGSISPSGGGFNTNTTIP